MDLVDIEIGRRVKTARIKAGVTQVVLANTIGQSQSFMAKVENGNLKLTVSDAFSMSEALGIKIDELIGRVAPEINPQ